VLGIDLRAGKKKRVFLAITFGGCIYKKEADSG